MAFAVAFNAVRIESEDVALEVAEGRAEFAEGELEGLGFADGMSVKEVVNGGIGGDKVEAIGDFETVLTESAGVPFSGDAERCFVNELQSDAWLNVTGGGGGPATQQVPSTQAQVFRDKEPDAGQVTADFIT